MNVMPQPPDMGQSTVALSHVESRVEQAELLSDIWDTKWG